MKKLLDNITAEVTKAFSIPEYVGKKKKKKQVSK